jgi:hypothetical protein
MVDLSRALEGALDGPVDIITASGLLDLVSERWLERLAVEISARSIPLYAAISHDGRIEFVPLIRSTRQLSRRSIGTSAPIGVLGRH